MYITGYIRYIHKYKSYIKGEGYGALTVVKERRLSLSLSLYIYVHKRGSR